MKNALNRFRRICNKNAGALGFIAIVVMIIGLIPFNQIDFGLFEPFFEELRSVLMYQIRVPIYILLISILLGMVYVNVVANRLKQKSQSIGVIEGYWKNEWEHNGETGSELCQISRNGKYYVNGRYIFKIKNLKYDYDKGKIEFIKSASKVLDDRVLINVLKIEDKDVLVGKENEYNIKYTRM